MIWITVEKPEPVNGFFNYNVWVSRASGFVGQENYKERRKQKEVGERI